MRRLFLAGLRSSLSYSVIQEPPFILRSVCSLSASADLSSSYSKIRQVPDNQEVYLDKNGFTSLTFDITERVSHLSTDRDALEYHFADIVAENDTRDVRSVVENEELPNFS